MHISNCRWCTFLIDVADTDLSVIYQNGHSFKARGLEVETHYKPSSGLDVFLNADYTRGDNGDEFPGSHGFNYKFVPSLNFKAGISKGWNAWILSSIIRRQDATQGPQGPIHGWTSLDFKLQYHQYLKNVSVRHLMYVTGAGNQERWFPEYTRRNANAVPDGMGRQAGYVLTVSF